MPTKGESGFLQVHKKEKGKKEDKNSRIDREAGGTLRLQGYKGRARRSETEFGTVGRAREQPGYKNKRYLASFLAKLRREAIGVLKLRKVPTLRQPSETRCMASFHHSNYTFYIDLERIH